MGEELINKEFNICQSFSLSLDDLNSLSLLYLPIIGDNAFSLYTTFTSLVMRTSLLSDSFNHLFIYDLLGISEIQFIKSRKILEAVGLLNSYEKNGSYVYVICEPLSPKQFLSDGVLGVVLYSKIGEENYNRLRDRFRIFKFTNKNEYNNITASFDEVYESKVENIPKNEDSYLVDRKKRNNLKYNSYNFDIKLFIKNIDTSLVKAGITESFKKHIIEMSTLYQFDENDMIALFNESLNKEGYFDLALLKKQCVKFYKYRHNSMPIIEPKAEIKNDERLNAIENASVEEFLSSILGEHYTKDDLNTYLELTNRLTLNSTVIKIMIMYVVKAKLKEKGEIDLPGLSYFQKVEADWIDLGITDAYHAFNRFILNQTEDKPLKQPKSTKKTPVRKKDKFEQLNESRDVMEGVTTL